MVWRARSISFGCIGTSEKMIDDKESYVDFALRKWFCEVRFG